jgi:hypothetical protein
VCTTEVVVVRPGIAGTELCCGGAPMVDIDALPSEPTVPDPAFATGTQLGKRYTSESDETLEVLVTKAGNGTLTTAGHALSPKTAKPLPASD